MRVVLILCIGLALSACESEFEACVSKQLSPSLSSAGAELIQFRINRLVESLDTAEKLSSWRKDVDDWLESNPEPAGRPRTPPDCSVTYEVSSEKWRRCIDNEPGEWEKYEIAKTAYEKSDDYAQWGRRSNENSQEALLAAGFKLSEEESGPFLDEFQKTVNELVRKRAEASGCWGNSECQTPIDAEFLATYRDLPSDWGLNRIMSFVTIRALTEAITIEQKELELAKKRSLEIATAVCNSRGIYD